MKRICAYPGCKDYAVKNSKFCEKHKPLSASGTTSKYKYMYDRTKWRKRSREFLTENIWCVECLKQGKYVLATEVDHIIPHEGNEKLFWDEKNWQPLCTACHSRKTMEENRQKGKI